MTKGIIMTITTLFSKLWIQILIVMAVLISLMPKVRVRGIEQIFMIAVIGYSISIFGILILKNKHNDVLGSLRRIFEYSSRLFAPFVWACIIFAGLIMIGG